MYTILMDDDKSLSTSVRTTLYQGENLVDKIQFLCPEFYEELSLKKCKVLLKYIDHGNVPHCETLKVDDELYKGKVRCVLPLDTELTRFAGDILISLTFTYTDEEIRTKYTLHSGDVKITINPKDVGFQLCDGDVSDDNNGGGDDNTGEDSTAEEEFKAVEF